MTDEQIEKALRVVISDLDYDLHKNLEDDEMTGENRYPELVEQFRQAAE